MKVLAEAEANAAISVLHALGLGKGCSIGIDLKVLVRLVLSLKMLKRIYIHC